MATPSIPLPSPSPSPSPSTTAPVTSAHPKLDGVLYHFYTKTIALICSERLGPHGDPLGAAEGVSAPTTGGPTSSSGPPSTSSSAPAKRTSKWFAIETPELALFKDELRLWRQPSTLIPASVLSDLPLERSTLPPYVPELILDVILDLNLVPEHAIFRQRGPDAIQIKRPSEVKGIVLERWRLSFDVHTVPAPPELSAIYNTCIAHFQALDARLRSLPAHATATRLRSSHDTPLRLGLRLSAGEVEEAPSVLPPAAALPGWPHRPTSYAFAPIDTGIGSLLLRVEGRADFDVEVLDAATLAEGVDLADFDEGYFRSVAPKAPLVASAVDPNASPAVPRSLLSRAGSQRASQAGGSQLPILPSQSTPSPPVVPHAATESILSRSPAPQSSALGPAAGSKPVAGLSSLREPSALSTSPANARAPLSSEAAFLTHQRRQSSSASDRRLRTLSTFSSERSSPPSPTTAASPQSFSRPGLATRASLFPSLRMGSYSPSSPSPLAQQMTARQQSSAHSAALGQAQIAAGTSPTLRSVFHSYTSSQSPVTAMSPFARSLGRSAGESALGLARAEEAFAQDSLSYTASAASTSPSLQSTAARPQMIQRYSSTLSYRQGRARRSSASLTSGEGGTTQAEPGTSEDSNYSRSWQARIEQRHAYATAYNQASSSDPRSLGTPDADSKRGGFAIGTTSPRPSLRYASISGSQDDDLNDLVRMIDSRVAIRADPAQAHVSTKSLAGALAMSPAGRGTGLATSAFGSGTIARRRGSFRAGGTSSPLSRSQVNEMLSRMAASFGRPSPASAATTGSGGSGSEGSPSQAIGTSAEGSPSITRSPLSAPPVSASARPVRPSHDTSSQVRALSSAAGGTATAPILARPRQAGLPSVRPAHSYDLEIAVEPSGAALTRDGSRIGRGGRGGGGSGSGTSGGSASASASVTASANMRRATSDDARISPTSQAPQALHGGHRHSRGSIDLPFPRSYDDEPIGTMDLGGEPTSDAYARNSAQENEALAQFLARRRGGGNGQPHVHSVQTSSIGSHRRPYSQRSTSRSASPPPPASDHETSERA